MPLGEGVELKTTALVPKPNVCVDHLAHAGRDRIGRCLPSSFFNFTHHFGGMARRSHPVGARHLAFLVNFDIQNAHCVKHGWHAALEDSIAVEFVEVLGGVDSVFTCIAST